MFSYNVTGNKEREGEIENDWERAILNYIMEPGTIETGV